MAYIELCVVIIYNYKLLPQVAFENQGEDMDTNQSSRPTDAVVSAEEAEAEDTSVTAEPPTSTKFADMAREHAMRQ